MDDITALNDAGRAHLDQLDAISGLGFGDAVSVEDLIVPADDPIVVGLVRQYLRDGELPNDLLDQHGRTQGVTGRTMRNRVKRVVELMHEGGTAPDRGWRITADVCDMIAACNGKVATAYAAMVDQGVDLPSPSTVWRQWNALEAGYRRMITEGREGFLQSVPYAPWESAHRNACWQADYVPLPVDVIPFGHETTTVMPQVLIYQDDRTRLVTAWSLECRPGRRGTAALSVATLAGGLEGSELGGELIGGRPDVVRVDNDAAFLADEMSAIAGAVGFDIRATPPYSPFMKGKVERVGKTLQDNCIALMQGFTHGPASFTGRNPFRDGGAVTEAALWAHLESWFRFYNESRIHSALEDGTPLRAWAGSDHPVRFVEPDKLREFLLPQERNYRAQKHGIWWDGQYWTGPGIAKVIGRTVTFRRPVGPDPDRIEVFCEGQWALTAVPAKTLSKEARDALRDERSDLYERAMDTIEAAVVRRADATAVAEAGDFLIRPAATPSVDRLAADHEELFELLDNDNDNDDSNDTTVAPGEPVTSGGVSRRKRRTPKVKPQSRRRPEREDPGPGDDLWTVFAEIDAEANGNPDDNDEVDGDGPEGEEP